MGTVNCEGVLGKVVSSGEILLNSLPINKNLKSQRKKEFKHLQTHR